MLTSAVLYFNTRSLPTQCEIGYMCRKHYHYIYYTITYNL